MNIGALGILVLINMFKVLAHVCVYLINLQFSQSFALS